ncbi:MAG: DUF4159 domain-containing protein [Pirellula sp.]
MRRTLIAASLISLTMLSIAGARWQQGFREQGFREQGFREQRTPDRSEFPVWQNDPHFQSDVFVFARIKYSSMYGGRGNRWENDFPDSDWNFSYRLQQLSSMKVHPNGRVLELTDPDLFDFPFLFMNGVGSLQFSKEEAEALRRHLLNGGFIMVDDFWGEEELENMKDQMRLVFPGREPKLLSLAHPLFHIVYDMKEIPQVPDIRTWRSGSMYEFNHRGSPGDMKPHFLAYVDDNDRIVALLCHNNDLGDGWEREGANEDYFETFSVPFSYPMGINIITYAMTN